MSAPRRVTDQQLLSAYEDCGNVHEVGRRLGIHGSSAHERLTKLGVVKPINSFTEAERERLVRDYAIYRAHGKVSDLAAELGRTVQFLSRQARALGLTDASADKIWKGHWKHMSDEAARVLMDDFKTSPLTLSQFCEKHGYSTDGLHLALKKRWPDEWDHVIEAKVPASTMYRLGRAVEYRFKELMEAEGYVVMRSPASKSPVDLVAIKPGQVLFVQCKRSGSLPPKEWNALYDLAESAGALPIMAERPLPRVYRYWLLTARKDGTKRRQPMTPFVLDEGSEA